ncbi:MAG: WD40/YVTN/BNR-like repeat-containing protein [Streptosporangiaceae bacterium]
MMNRITAVTAGLALALGGGLAAAASSAAAAASQPNGPASPAVGPVPAGFQPVSMTFVSASEGWVLGTAPCSHKPCTSVVRTTDGGRTWVGIPAPRYPLAGSGASGGLTRLRFADPEDGFAYGSQLWVTHNGGASWRRVSQVPGYIVDLEASAGRVYAASAKSSRVTIYESPAGRNAWHRVTGLASVIGYGGLGTITLHGTAAWIILGGPDGGRLYATQTGSRWVREGFKCATDFFIASVAAYDNRRITLLCTGLPAAGSTQKVLYSSADGGTHFTRVGSAPSGGDGGLLAEPTTRNLFVATSSGATWLYASTDGGRRWHDNLTLDDGGKGWSDFGFTTATQGVAIEGRPSDGSHLYLTRNTGQTWHKVRF